jgi:hypothetical protein
MSILDKEIFFSGDDSIENNDLGKVEVANFLTDVDDALKSHFG